MDTTNLATYFVQRTSDNALLGRDDIWYPPAACRRILFKLCRFDRDSAARKAKSCQYAAKPIEEKDARACLGFKSPSWNKFWATNIKTIKVCVFTTENALEAENNRHPEPGRRRKRSSPRKRQGHARSMRALLDDSSMRTPRFWRSRSIPRSSVRQWK